MSPHPVLFSDTVRAVSLYQDEADAATDAGIGTAAK
jgi:hypothetical protein